jgi:hypothetical protein
VPDRSLKKKLRKKAKKAQRRQLGEAIEKDGRHARAKARAKKK